MSFGDYERKLFYAQAEGARHSLVMCLQMIETKNFLMARGFLDYARELLTDGLDLDIRVALDD